MDYCLLAHLPHILGPAVFDRVEPSEKGWRWTFAPAGVDVQGDDFQSQDLCLQELREIQKGLYPAWHEKEKRAAHLQQLLRMRSQQQRLETLAHAGGAVVDHMGDAEDPGKCEIIARAGFMTSWAKPHLCSRYALSPVYREMYCYENLQHLGQRHDALSNLTWYESLLIARVHSVISVVTLTATGLLCYAGHVCNYYVKVMEWIRGLPAVLRDKKWFLIKKTPQHQGRCDGHSTEDAHHGQSLQTRGGDSGSPAVHDPHVYLAR